MFQMNVTFRMHPHVLNMQCSSQSFGFDPLLTQTEKTEQLPSPNTHKRKNNFCLDEVYWSDELIASSTVTQSRGGGGCLLTHS